MVPLVIGAHLAVSCISRGVADVISHLQSPMAHAANF